MKILGCFSWPYNGIENAMYYKEGFSWCCISWSFHEATEFMPHEKPMVFPLMLKDELAMQNIHGFFVAFGRPMKINSSMAFYYFHGVNKI